MEEYKTRPSWEEYFKSLVKLTASRSPCERLQVGCIFVKDNRIIAQGYNGYIPGCDHKSVIKDNHNVAIIHAEQNTITDCAKRGVSSDGCCAYVTHRPCYNCMQLMVSSGIKQIKYINDYKNDDLVTELSNKSGVNILKI
jgi:dCMP deaminase